MSNQQRLLLGVLVAGNVVPVGYLFARSSFLASKSVPAHPAAAGRLPFVEMRDDRGAVVTTSSLIGSPLFVQFVNPYVDQQIASLRVLLASRSNNPVRFLLITSDAATLRNRLHVMMERALVVEERDYQLRDAFQAPRCCERWILFDQTGNLAGTGRYESGDALSHLLAVADGRRAYSPDVLSDVLERLNESGDLEQIHSAALRSPSHRAIVVIYSSVCTVCSSGTLVELLNASADHDTGRHIISVVNGLEETGMLVERFRKNSVGPGAERL
jgi:hypothetical protein